MLVRAFLGPAPASLEAALPLSEGTDAMSWSLPVLARKSSGTWEPSPMRAPRNRPEPFEVGLLNFNASRLLPRRDARYCEYARGVLAMMEEVPHIWLHFSVSLRR